MMFIYIHLYTRITFYICTYNCITNIAICERPFVSSSEGQLPERSALKSQPKGQKWKNHQISKSKQICPCKALGEQYVSICLDCAKFMNTFELCPVDMLMICVNSVTVVDVSLCAYVCSDWPYFGCTMARFIGVDMYFPTWYGFGTYCKLLL